MKFDYARAKATADRLIGNAGQTGKLRVPTATGPAYDPTPGSPIDYPVTFAVASYKNSEIDGTRVLASDKKVVLAIGNLPVRPATSHRLVIKGIEHAIKAADPAEPGDTTLLWIIQARR